MTYPWQEIEALSTAALVVTGISAIFFAYFQLRQDRDATRIENLEKQIACFDSEQFLELRRSLAEKRTTQDKLKTLPEDDAPSELYDILNFFEHLAFLVRRKHLTTYDVWHSFGYWAFCIYYDARRVI